MCVSHGCAGDTVSLRWGQPRRGENFPLLLAVRIGLFGPEAARFGRLEVPEPWMGLVLKGSVRMRKRVENIKGMMWQFVPMDLIA